MKKKILAIVLSAALLASITGCGSDNKGAEDGVNSASQNESQTSELMDKDAYLAEAEGLNSATEGFMAAVLTMADENTDIEDSIEAIRNSKEPFIVFSKLDNPPEEYKESHAKLAVASGKFGDFIDRYADFLKDANDGAIDIDTEYSEKLNELTAELEEISEELGNALGEVRNV